MHAGVKLRRRSNSWKA